MTTDERIAEIKDSIDAGIDIPHDASVWMFEALSTLTAQRDEAIGHVRVLVKQLNRIPQSFVGYYEVPVWRVAEAFLATVPDAGQAETKGDDDEGMMRVGYSLMASIEAYYEHPSMKGWAPADDPAEIVGDLLNIIDEKDVQIAKARNAALDEALKICTSHIEVTKAVLSVASDSCRVRIHTAVLIIDSIRALKTQTDGATE